MKLSIPKVTASIAGLLIIFTLSSFQIQERELFSLTIKVQGLRNSKGIMQFALYNKEGTIPDADYKNYYRILVGPIVDGVSKVEFRGLPKGRYAVNVLHDENKNGRIDKGLILPKEGIGFSNYESIGIGNRPSFSKSSFYLNADTMMSVKIIYM